MNPDPPVKLTFEKVQGTPYNTAFLLAWTGVEWEIAAKEGDVSAFDLEIACDVLVKAFNESKLADARKHVEGSSL